MIGKLLEEPNPANVLRACLTDEERSTLAFWALSACDAAHYVGLCDVPDPAWAGTMAEARAWAAPAHPTYLKAIALASFEAMRPEHQCAFAEYVAGILDEKAAA